MSEPPKFAEWLVRLLVGGRDADIVAGDLRETFAERGGGRLWYWGQVLSCLALRFSFYRRMLPGIGTDFARALRRIRRNPGYAVTAMVCLALALGVNTTLFGFLDSMFFRRLPVPEADRIVQVRRVDSAYCKWRQFVTFRDNLHSMEVTAESAFADSVETGQSGFDASVEAVSANYAHVLRIGTALGRWFRPESDSPSADAVAVISYALWQTRFGGDREILGKSIHVLNHDFHVVGVAPRGFTGTLPPMLADAWVPVAAAVRGVGLNLIGRLVPGATMAGAAAEMNVVSARLHAADPENEMLVGSVQVHPDSGFLWGNGRDVFMPALQLLAVVSLVVLLIACVNVANLLLSRAAVRQKEMAIRQSLGAGRARLFRETLAEGLVLAAGAVVLGILAGYWSGRALQLLMPSVPDAIYRGLDLGIDWRVALFLTAAGIASAILFSLPPAFAVSRRNLTPAMKDGGAKRSRQREIYPVAQVALSLTLLISTGLLLRALQRVEHVDPGFAADHVLSVTMKAPGDSHSPAIAQAFSTLVDEARRMPGVQDATLAWEVFPNSGAGCVAAGHGEPQPVRTNIVDPNYFALMRIPILRGSGFSESARRTDTPGVIVNQTMAHNWWPGEEAIGKTLWLGCQTSGRQMGTVVGIARDAKYEGLDDANKPFYYLSRREQAGNGYFSLLVRTAGEPEPWTRPLLELAGRSGRFRIYEARTLEDSVSLSLWEVKWQASLLAAMGLLAAVLAAIGVYGVVACAVAQRTREIGVRMALGATPADVQWMVLAHGLKLTAMGIGSGLLLSAATVRFLRSFLYGLSPFDPVAFAAAGLAWIVIALLASWYPARRATRVDPLTALNYE